MFSVFLTAISYRAMAQEKAKPGKIIELAKFIDGLSKQNHWKLLYNPDDLSGKYVDEAAVGASAKWTIAVLSEWIKKYNLQIQPLGGETYSVKSVL